jgi:hypothetical protein
MPNATETRADRIANRLRDHWLLSSLIVLGSVVVALGQLTSSVDSLRRFFYHGPPPVLTREYCDFLVPLVVQFDRTKDAFERWNERNLPLETQIIRDGNLKARDLLERYSQLVPQRMQQDRQKLVQHYDRWLEEYQRLREGPNAKSDEPFVFVGPEGYPFPTDSESRCRARLDAVRSELGGQPECASTAR